MAAAANSMVWFRKGLRVHDNPALSDTAAGAARLFPVFVLDPHYLAPDPAAFSPGSSLADLDSTFRGLGSRLLVFLGDPPEVVVWLLKEWKIGKLCFEADSEPYAQIWDKSGLPIFRNQKFGCLSCRFFYQCLQDVCKKVKKHTLPPVSLFGQLLWREFFYTAAYGTPNLDCMDDNKICKQVPWSTDEELLAA